MNFVKRTSTNMEKSARIYIYEAVVIYITIMTIARAVNIDRVFNQTDLDAVIAIQQLYCTERRSCSSGHGENRTEEESVAVNASLYQHLINVDIPEYTTGTCCSECSCDTDTCMFHGTCCPDMFDHVPTVEESHARIKASCEYVNFMGVSGPHQRPRGNPRHMVRKCPDDYTDSTLKAETKNKCENPTRYSSLEGSIPVTDTSTYLAYENVHCSICHDIPQERLVYWDTYAACKNKGDETQLYSTSDNIVDIVKHSRSCNLIYEPSEPIMNKTKGCRYVIKECNATGLLKTYDPLQEAACHAYSSLYDFKYQNIFCAMCNQEDIIGNCNDQGPFDFPPSFSVLLNFDVKQPATAYEEPGDAMCMESQVFDKMDNVCRNLHCRFPKTLLGKECVHRIASVYGGSYKIYLKLTPDREVSVLNLGNVQHTLQVHIHDLLEQWGITEFVYKYNIYFKKQLPIQESTRSPDPITHYTKTTDSISDSIENEESHSRMTPVSLSRSPTSSVASFTQPPTPPPFKPLPPPSQSPTEEPISLTPTPTDTATTSTPPSLPVLPFIPPSSGTPPPTETATTVSQQPPPALSFKPPPPQAPPSHVMQPLTLKPPHINKAIPTTPPPTTPPPTFPAVLITSPIQPSQFTERPPSPIPPPDESSNYSISIDLDELAQSLPGIDYFLFYINFHFLPSAGKQDVATLDQILDINGESVYLYNNMTRFAAWFNYSLEDYGHNGNEYYPVLVDTNDNVSLEIIPEQMHIYHFNITRDIDFDSLSPDVLAEKSRCPLLNVKEEALGVDRVWEGLRVNNINTTLPMKYVYQITENDGNVNYFICSHAYMHIANQFLQHVDNAITVEKDNNLPQRILSVVCTSLSIICNVFTLTTYTLFKELRTQPGLNNMSHIVCLIFAQLLFQFGLGAAEDVSDPVCIVIGVFIHFSWLLVVIWMSVCSYHMFRVFINTFKRRNHAGKAGTTILYWCLTLLTAGVFVVTNILVSFFTSENTDFGYSTVNCYISQPYMIGYVFALPVGFFVLTNLILFVIVIVTVNKQPSVNSDSKTGRNYVKIYAKLSTITGLTWTFGFLYTFTEINIFEYIFIVMNASQGIFIFLAFVLNRRVVNLYKARFVKLNSSEIYKISGTKCSTIAANKTV